MRSVGWMQGRQSRAEQCVLDAQTKFQEYLRRVARERNYPETAHIPTDPGLLLVALHSALREITDEPTPTLSDVIILARALGKLRIDEFEPLLALVERSLTDELRSVTYSAKAFVRTAIEKTGVGEDSSNQPTLADLHVGERRPLVGRPYLPWLVAMLQALEWAPNPPEFEPYPIP